MKKIIFLFLFYSLATLNGDLDETYKMKEEVCKRLPFFEGWCSREKALNFVDLVLETKPEVCVEIGVFGGASLFPVASALKFLDSGKVIAIDPWDKFECIKEYDPIEDRAQIRWWSELNLNGIYNSYLKQFKQQGLEKYCITYKCTSEQAIQFIDTIDILHIDGNHSEKVSTMDVSLYLPKVVQGGYIWMNDTLWSERQEAIELLLKECDVIKLIDNGNCILFKKR